MISVPGGASPADRARAMLRRATACRSSAVVLRRTGRPADAARLVREAAVLESQAQALTRARPARAA